MLSSRCAVRLDDIEWPLVSLPSAASSSAAAAEAEAFKSKGHAEVLSEISRLLWFVSCAWNRVVCGLWFGGLWFGGLWFVVCGLWFVVCGLWFVVCCL
jgi:hypothetical protein